MWKPSPLGCDHMSNVPCAACQTTAASKALFSSYKRHTAPLLEASSANVASLFTHFSNLLSCSLPLLFPHKWPPCPIDIGSRNAQWRDSRFAPFEVSSQEGLADLIVSAHTISRHYHPPTPLLVQENFHYCLLKLVYIIPSSKYNLHSLRHNAPPP